MEDPSTLRAYMMEQRRILRDQVASLERMLGIDSKERQLQDRVAELERRLMTNGVHSIPPRSAVR